MIFNTFKSDTGGFANNFGLFGASFQQIKQYGLGSAFGKLDTNVLLQYNEAIKSGCSHTQAYNVALTDLDGNLINVNNATKKAMETANGQVISLEKINSGARASAIGMGLLKAAMNFGIMMAVTGLIELGKYLWKLVPTTEHLKEKLEETAQALADIKSESESIKDELKTIQDRISELESKGALSFTDEAELTRLKQENAELERKLVLLDEERKIKSKEQQDTFKKTVASDYFSNHIEFTSKYDLVTAPGGAGYVYDKISESQYIDEQFRYLKEQEAKLETATKKEREKIEKEIEKTEKYLSEEISTSQGYLDALAEAGYVYGSDAEVDKYIDWIYEFQDKYLVAVGNTSELFSSAINRPKYAEARTEIEKLANAGNLTAESLQNLYSKNDNVKEFVDYMLSLNTVDWENILGDKFTDVAGEDSIVSLDEALKAMSGDTELASKIMGLFVNELNKVEGAAEGATTATTAFTNLSKDISSMVDKYDALSEAQKELAESGNLSVDTLKKLAEKYPELNDDIGEYLFGLISQEELMNRLQGQYNTDYSNYQKTMQSKLETSTEYYNSLLSTNATAINKIGEFYKVDLSNCETVEKAKIKIREASMTAWMKRYNQYVELTRNEARTLLRDLTVRNRNGVNDQKIADLKAYIKLLDGIDVDFSKINSAKLAKLDPKKLTTNDIDDKSGSETIKEAEDKIAYYKHRHEMGLISEATYYKKLEKIRKDYYAGKKKYLDRDRELQEEYHDWEVSKAEESYEKQAAKLQEQYVNGKITYAQLKSKLKALIKDTFKNDKDTKNKYLDELPEYLNESREEKRDKKEKEAEEKDKKNREDFDASYDKLKYQLENGFITEEKYYKDLDALYKKHYGNKTKYLDEYAQYSQEVYDGFKDMYKEGLEADKKTWEEKKEAVSEYYDELIEKIQDAHDEEDYEEEQTEKRQTLSDIERQIAELEKDGSEKAKARIAELEEDRKNAEKELEDFEKDHARQEEIERLEKEREAREKEIENEIKEIDKQLEDLNTNTATIRDLIIDYAKEKGVTLKFAHASGTRSSPGGFGRINEKGIEMISAPDGNGNYIPMLPNSYVFSAKATEFLWKLATEHSLPQAMYNSIAKSIKTQSNTPSVNIAQPITITMGDIIIKGNADKQTVADIKKQQENTVRMVLQKIKELQK